MNTTLASPAKNRTHLPTMVADHRKFVRSLVGITEEERPVEPTIPDGWITSKWPVRHAEGPGRAISSAKLSGRDNDRVCYAVTVQHPTGFHAGTIPGRSRDIVSGIEKADSPSSRNCDGGRWITVHPHGDQEPGQAVYLCPNPDGSHTIVSGAGGRLNGLRLLGVKSEADYKQLARQKRAERQRQQAIEAEVHRHSVGIQQFAAEQAQRQAILQERATTKNERERQAIATVLQAQGIDPSVMEVPKESLAGLDRQTADTIQRRYHEKLLTYAKRIGDSVRALVSAGVEQLAETATGDIGVGDLVAASHGTTIGYQSPIKALADDIGLGDEAKAGIVEGVKMRSLLDRTGMDLHQAASARQTSKETADRRRESESKVADAVEALKEQGIGPAAISSLPTVANVQTMGDAVQILQALKNADLAGKAHREVARTSGLDALPKAALMPVRELSDAEAKDAIAADIDEDSRRQAMIALVTDSNAQERRAPKTLTEHLSVGQNESFNGILGAVDGSHLDPILHDVLGASGAARVIAARLRQTLPDEDFDNLRETLAKHHVATQEALARSAVGEAQEYMTQADAIDPERQIPDTAEGLATSLSEQAKRLDLIDRARESLGVARGRLEAAAALNDALMRTGDGNKPTVISLGAMSPADALESALALGLSRPTRRDPETGDVIEQGDFDIHHDGKNSFLTLEPSGLRELANRWTVDPETVARADRSARIKRGDMDEVGYVPAGLSRRPVSAYEVEPLEAVRPDIATLGIDASDSGEQMQGKIRNYIGAMLAAGRDPLHIESTMRGEDFIAGLGLSPTAASRYQKALAEFSPQWMPDQKQDMSQFEAAQQEVARYREFQQARDQRYQACLDDYLKGQHADASLDGQRIGTDGQTMDCAYVAALQDPRLRFAFSKVGDLSPDARASVRRYAYQNLFGMDPKTEGDTLLSPLTQDEHRAWQSWNALSDREGDPYRAIQQHWRDESAKDVDLFGDPAPSHPLAACDLTDDTSVVQAARQVPQMLGYAPVQRRQPDGQITESYGDLEPSDSRPMSTIAADARTRIRQALRRRFLSDMVSLPDLAAQDFNPSSVKTAGDRWAEYASSMGETNAYRTVQEFMQGDFSQRFAAEYSKRTGTPLKVASRPIERAERHAVAMLPPQQREQVLAMSAGERAKFIKRFRGKWVKTDGGVRDQAEAAAAAGQEGAKLFGDDSGMVHVATERPSMGKAAEATIAGMLPRLGLGNGQADAVQGLDLSGERAPAQRAIKLIEANKRQSINLGTGMGKAQPLDAKVLTPTGWRLMGDMRVGDAIIAGDGTATIVTGIYPQGEKDIYRVTMSDGATTECCDEHLWFTQTRAERKQYSGARGRSIASKYPNCAYDFEKHRGMVRSLADIRGTLFGQGGAKNHTIPLVQPVEFPQQAVPIDAYVLGVLLGDGCFRGATPSLSSEDHEILDSVAALLPQGMRVTKKEKCDYVLNGWQPSRKTVNSVHGTYEMGIRVNPLRMALVYLGLWMCSSETKFIPDIYLYNSIDVRLSVLQGLMDTDGTVQSDTRSCVFYSISRTLADQVVYLVRSLGGTATVNTKSPKYSHRGELRQGKTCYSVIIRLASSSQIFRLNRKKSLVVEKTKYPPVRFIVGVDYVGRKAAQCIAVEHPSHLYVTDDLIVTHNTLVGVGAFTSLRSQGKANRALFVVPSNVVGQFPSEIDKFRDPAVPLYHFAASGVSPQQRREAMANKNLHVVITTPEALREDTLHAMAAHRGQTRDEVAAWMAAPSTPESERHEAVTEAMQHAGYDFDYGLFDEAHRLLERQGKPDALMQRVADGVSSKLPYYVSATADPVKNDVSEAFSLLHKVAPEQFPLSARESFLRTYGRNTRASGLALQRVMEPYIYPEKIDLGIHTDTVLPEEGRMKLTADQQKEYDGVLDAYQTARRAKLRGGIDIAALKRLSPSSFEKARTTAEESEIAGGLNKALATIRDARLGHVTDCYPGGAKENYIADYVGQHRGEPAVVFAHNLDAVKNLTARLKKDGHRVVAMTGEMDTQSKNRARLAFQPPKGEPQADVIVMSDAGAMGANLQRGIHQLNVDVPLTSMVHQQRLGRIRRIGQKSTTIHHRDLVTNTDFDQRSRSRLAGKAALRELLTSPSASIDDSGLSTALETAGVRAAVIKAAQKYGGTNV